MSEYTWCRQADILYTIIHQYCNVQELVYQSVHMYSTGTLNCTPSITGLLLTAGLVRCCVRTSVGLGPLGEEDGPVTQCLKCPVDSDFVKLQEFSPRSSYRHK